MRIVIRSIPQAEHRYDTLGDWRFEDGGLRIDVSDHLAEDQQFLVALHELVEARLCQKRGITAEQVDRFDQAFDGVSEPGDDAAAPYRREHRFAMLIERLVAHEMGVEVA